ncbi:DoxX family protein [Hydrogenophaga sp. PBL-H3]|uniref:DoxX family protein n=1 Tax=Hydrogenophaga sp. PBL-H3 TaxID=434010 RepID=UPI0013204C1C|nr:DoxX family protein [Hydrogenophaga sp. PBL-H3]QHE74726.1 DoxX family protein [Hydrogenophaga sp. PBL-H3]QHE79152.1 DoxX family protein [Hydrogenophaga sp. PBL-H3]
MKTLNALLDHPRAGVLLLRWTLAILMIFHGWAKVMGGVGGIEGMLVARGLPGYVAYGVYLGELIAPLFLLAGVWVVPAALVMAINMAFAVALAHMGHFLDLASSGGWRLELQAFFFMSALVVALTNRLGPNR